MTENNKNRFTDNETDCLIDSSFTDNLTKKIYVIDEWERIIGLCNNLWEQTQRFEKENQRLNTEIEQLKQEVESITSKNKILLEHCDDLQERNDRQADTIRELYNLIEKQDWETLTDRIEELNKAEEQLKIEMRCYE